VNAVLTSSGLNPELMSQQGLIPAISSDKDNKYGGASAYIGKTNQILLGKADTQGLSDPNNISKDAFIALVHELRHAIQADFGQNSLSDVAKKVGDGNKQLISQNNLVEILNLENLLNPGLSKNVFKQAEKSTSGVADKKLAKGVMSLEVDAEVFAQNVAQQVMPGNKRLSIEEILSRLSTNLNNSINNLDYGQEELTSIDSLLTELTKELKKSSIFSPNKPFLVKNLQANTPLIREPNIVLSTIELF